MLACGPNFSKIYFHYNIPYSKNYYKILPKHDRNKSVRKNKGKNRNKNIKTDSDSHKQSEFIEVQEERFLQWDSPISKVQNQNNNAVALSMNGKWVKATKIWENLYRKYPNDLATINNLGIAYSVQGYHDKALKYFAKCLSIKRHNVYIYHYKATVNLSDKYRPLIK